MALVYRYLGFLKHEENLPQGVRLNLSFFLNEFCGTSFILRKALEWAKKQNGWLGDKGMAQAFYYNFIFVENPSDHIPTAITCFDELPKFKNQVNDMLHEDLMRFLDNYDDKRCKTLLRFAFLASELYSMECTPTTQIFEVLRAILKSSMSVTRQIEMYDMILAKTGTAIYLKQADVDQRFLSTIAMEKLNLSIHKKCELSLSLEEIEQVIRALIEFRLFTDDALQYQKPGELQILIINWVNDGADLQQTLADFVTLEFKYPEQMIHCAHHMTIHAMFDVADHAKLVALQKHLRQDIYKSKPRLFDNAWRDVLKGITDQVIETADRDQIDNFFQYLGEMYNHSVVDWFLIDETLKRFVATPDDVNSSAFALLFAKVEDKLKTEISEADMKDFIIRMSQIFVGGKFPLTSPCCLTWIAKKDKELGMKKKQKDVKKEEAVPENLFTAENLGKSIEDYCKGTYSLTRVLKDFEKVKTMPADILVKVFLVFIFESAMVGVDSHKKIAVLVKSLKTGVFKHRASELNNIIFELMRYNMKNFFDDSVAPINKDRSLRFVDFLNQLFVKDVVDEELIVESLDRFLEGWDELNDACFTAMFTRVDIKLRPKISEEKFEEYTEHLEGYIIRNYDGCELPLACQQYLDRKNGVEPQKCDEKAVKDKKAKSKKAKPKVVLASSVENSKVSKNPVKSDAEAVSEISSKVKNSSSLPKQTHVPRKVQRMIINFQEFENPEKRNEITVNLMNILSSENRMRIFVKHMLESPKTDLKEILLHSKLAVALAKFSNENFNFRDCLTSTIHAEYLRTNAIANFTKKAKAKLNRIELISGELWRNNLMATKKFAGLLMSKNMRHLPTESLAHLSMIVGGLMHSDGNSKLKLAVRMFEAFIHDFTVKSWSDLKDDLEDVGAEFQMLLSYEESLLCLSNK